MIEDDRLVVDDTPLVEHVGMRAGRIGAPAQVNAGRPKMTGVSRLIMSAEAWSPQPQSETIGVARRCRRTAPFARRSWSPDSRRTLICPILSVPTPGVMRIRSAAVRSDPRATRAAYTVTSSRSDRGARFSKDHEKRQRPGTPEPGRLAEVPSRTDRAMRPT